MEARAEFWRASARCLAARARSRSAGEARPRSNTLSVRCSASRASSSVASLSAAEAIASARRASACSRFTSSSSVLKRASTSPSRIGSFSATSTSSMRPETSAPTVTTRFGSRLPVAVAVRIMSPRSTAGDSQTVSPAPGQNRHTSTAAVSVANRAQATRARRLRLFSVRMTARTSSAMASGDSRSGCGMRFTIPGPELTGPIQPFSVARCRGRHT